MVDNVVLHKVSKQVETFKLWWSLEKSLAFAVPRIYPQTPMSLCPVPKIAATATVCVCVFFIFGALFSFHERVHFVWSSQRLFPWIERECVTNIDYLTLNHVLMVSGG